MEKSLKFDLATQLAVIQARIADRNPARGPGVYDIPGVRMYCNPAETSPYSGNNPNRAELMPGVAEWSADSAGRVAAWYQSKNAVKYSFWLTACPEEKQIARDLSNAGFKRVVTAAYPVLARPAESMAMPETSLSIRPFDPATDSEAIREYPSPYHRDRLFRSIDHLDEQCFVAWAGETPVATASVVMNDWLGYLMGATTLEPYRGRGAQSALIAARVAYAATRGCRWVASETVSRAKTSVRNLQRQGFEEIFRKKVFDGPTTE